MIRESAILFPNGKIYTGKRHCDCFLAAREAGETSPRHDVQGFMTDDGKFLDRVEAGKHAIACGQIEELRFCTKRLFSEDLY